MNSKSEWNALLLYTVREQIRGVTTIPIKNQFHLHFQLLQYDKSFWLNGQSVDKAEHRKMFVFYFFLNAIKG